MTEPAALRATALATVGLRELGSMARTVAAIAVRDHPPLPTWTSATRSPVVLVHGYLATDAVLRPLARRLLAEGTPEVGLVRYPSVVASLEDVVDAIAGVALPLVRRHGRVDLVGHSLGAVASRAWLKCFGGAPSVRRFVSIGGPHAGTALYRLVPGPLRAVLDPRGPWVARLGQGHEPVPTVVVRARFDHQVLPPVAASIPGVTEVVLDGYGHNSLLFAPEAHDAVVAALTAPDQGV